MLYDKRWDAKIETKIDPLSIENFVAWLETKDPRGEYDYISANNCAYVQYRKACGAPANFSCGPEEIPQPFNELVHPLSGAGIFREMWRTVTRQSYFSCRGWTFGDLQRRARAELVKRG